MTVNKFAVLLLCLCGFVALLDNQAEARRRLFARRSIPTCGNSRPSTQAYDPPTTNAQASEPAPSEPKRDDPAVSKHGKLQIGFLGDYQELPPDLEQWMRKTISASPSREIDEEQDKFMDRIPAEPAVRLKDERYRFEMYGHQLIMRNPVRRIRCYENELFYTIEQCCSELDDLAGKDLAKRRKLTLEMLAEISKPADDAVDARVRVSMGWYSVKTPKGFARWFRDTIGDSSVVQIEDGRAAPNVLESRLVIHAADKRYVLAGPSLLLIGHDAEGKRIQTHSFKHESFKRLYERADAIYRKFGPRSIHDIASRTEMAQYLEKECQPVAKD